MVEKTDNVIIDGKRYLISTSYLKKYNIDKGDFAKNLDKWLMHIIKLGRSATLIEDVKPTKQKVKNKTKYTV